MMWLDCLELVLDQDELDNFFIQKVGVALDKEFWFDEAGAGSIRMNIACPPKILKGVLRAIESE